MRLRLIHFVKVNFIRLKLHRLFAPLKGISENIHYLTKLSEWVAKQPQLAYNDFPSKWDYRKRFGLYEHVLTSENLLEVPVNYLEFGVADGHSIRWFVSQNKNTNSKFCGFDTFTGLPEDFGVYKKGQFNTNNEVPKIDDQRVSFHTGLFQQTLPAFLNNLDNSRRNVIMLDADLYSATLYVLTMFAPFLKQGDIIFFDEFLVPTHEFKAYDDFIQAYPIQLHLIAATNNYYFSAFKVKGSIG